MSEGCSVVRYINETLRKLFSDVKSNVPSHACTSVQISNTRGPLTQSRRPCYRIPPRDEEESDNMD